MPSLLLRERVETGQLFFLSSVCFGGVKEKRIACHIKYGNVLMRCCPFGWVFVVTITVDWITSFFHFMKLHFWCHLSQAFSIGQHYLHFVEAISCLVLTVTLCGWKKGSLNADENSSKRPFICNLQKKENNFHHLKNSTNHNACQCQTTTSPLPPRVK